MRFLLLTDDDDGTLLIACEDREQAERLASAAVFSDGGVSAWLVPARTLEVGNGVDEDYLIQHLQDGWSTYDLHERLEEDLVPVFYHPRREPNASD